MAVPQVQKWNPMEVFDTKDDKNIALIQLNVPIQAESLILLWKKAVLKLLTDGASNRLHSCDKIIRDSYIPDIISGDFDSAKKDVLDYYKSKGCDIVQTPDQDETDFTKGLTLVVEKIKSNNLQVDSIVVLDEVYGRLDHIFANMNTLFKAQNMTDIPVYCVTENSVSCLLREGKHEINVSSPCRGDYCSLVPLGHPCNNVTTTGLKWNLNGDSMKFGQLISTSNAFANSDVVTVQTDTFLLWSMTRK